MIFRLVYKRKRIEYSRIHTESIMMPVRMILFYLLLYCFFCNYSVLEMTFVLRQEIVIIQRLIEKHSVDTLNFIIYIKIITILVV